MAPGRLLGNVLTALNRRDCEDLLTEMLQPLRLPHPYVVPLPRHPVRMPTHL